MSTAGKFLRRLAIASVLIIAAGIWPLMQAGAADQRVYLSAIAGFVLSLGNVLAGYAAIMFGRKRGGQEFNMIVFGSMTVRMLLMLGMIYLCLAYFMLPPIALVSSLFVCYMTFLVIEVHFLWITSRQTTPRPPLA